MIITTEKNGTKAVIRPEGWIDAQSAPEFRAALDALEPEITELVLALQKLEYISSAGLRILLGAHKFMQNNGKMRVINSNDTVNEIFEVTGFSCILNIER